jgi:hypothetical protein
VREFWDRGVADTGVPLYLCHALSYESTLVLKFSLLEELQWHLCLYAACALAFGPGSICGWIHLHSKILYWCDYFAVIQADPKLNLSEEVEASQIPSVAFSKSSFSAFTNVGLNLIEKIQNNRVETDEPHEQVCFVTASLLFWC